jgi:hypothetical protein
LDGAGMVHSLTIGSLKVADQCQQGLKLMPTKLVLKDEH